MARAPKTTTAPTGQIAPFGLRMLPELKEKIEQAARESGRSMNAEIVARLEASFGKTMRQDQLVIDHPDAQFSGIPLEEVINRIADAVAERTMQSREEGSKKI